MALVGPESSAVVQREAAALARPLLSDQLMTSSDLVAIQSREGVVTSTRNTPPSNRCSLGSPRDSPQASPRQAPKRFSLSARQQIEGLSSDLINGPPSPRRVEVQAAKTDAAGEDTSAAEVQTLKLNAVTADDVLQPGPVVQTDAAALEAERGEADDQEQAKVIDIDQEMGRPDAVRPETASDAPPSTPGGRRESTRRDSAFDSADAGKESGSPLGVEGKNGVGQGDNTREENGKNLPELVTGGGKDELEEELKGNQLEDFQESACLDSSGEEVIV